jgi:hypothetical protein
MPVAEWSKAACLLGLQIRILLGAWMYVSCEGCVLSGRGLSDGYHSSRGVLPNMVCHCVWSWNLKNEAVLVCIGLLLPWGGGEYMVDYLHYSGCTPCFGIMTQQNICFYICHKPCRLYVLYILTSLRLRYWHWGCDHCSYSLWHNSNTQAVKWDSVCQWHFTLTQILFKSEIITSFSKMWWKLVNFMLRVHSAVVTNGQVMLAFLFTHFIQHMSQETVMPAHLCWIVRISPDS